MSTRRDLADEGLSRLNDLESALYELDLSVHSLSDAREVLEHIRDTPTTTLAVLGEDSPIALRVNWDREAESPTAITVVINDTAPEVYDEDGNRIPYDDAQCFAWNSMLAHLVTWHHNIITVEVR